MAKRLLTMWVVLALGLLAFGGLVAAQDKDEDAQSKIVETRIVTQTPGCQSMMQSGPGMMCGKGQGSMGSGMMMGGKGCCGMGCCEKMRGGMAGFGKEGAEGKCEMENESGCGSCCERFHELGCPKCFIGMADELKLSDQQVADLKAIIDARKKDMVRKGADLKIAGMELDELVDAADPDFSKIRAKIGEIALMRQNMCLDQLATIEKAQRVLTADQMAKFKGMKKKMSCSAAKPCAAGKQESTTKIKKVIKMKTGEQK